MFIGSYYFRTPGIAFAQKMKEKTIGQVLSVELQDPNTTQGIIEVLKTYLKYATPISPCGNVRRKIVIHGNTVLVNIICRSPLISF